MDPLIVDVYEGDLNGRPDWSRLAAAGYPWCGAVLKATEGLHYAPDWFKHQWRPLPGSLVRGCYHYLRFNQSGKEQARYYLDAVQAAGGWHTSDLPPIVDVERANNLGATRDQVETCTNEFAETVLQERGVRPILYGGELLASLGITSKMGCGWLWVARYTTTLPAVVYERIGWKLEDLFAWQYAGDGYAELHRYPHESPMGKTDISAVVVKGGGTGAINWLAGRV